MQKLPVIWKQPPMKMGGLFKPRIPAQAENVMNYESLRLSVSEVVR